MLELRKYVEVFGKIYVTCYFVSTPVTNFEIFFECQKTSGNRWFSNLFSGNKKWNLGGKRVRLKFSSNILIIVVGLQYHEKKKSPKSY